ncbi:cytochrome P450 [Calocera cornea HHB12733]|uniref:Cytochrome P450 n=1 Tax=Calocera cornea HHB12733 TaxID=1353952 RepID=A0A165CMK8_9BASI|nr:cytochrome P450 [Calocera cornea HHB12733]
MLALYLLLLACVAAAFLLTLGRRIYDTVTRPALPPGPRPLPIIGNLLQLPKANNHLVFAEWSKSYGDIMSMTLLGKTFIILNSRRAVFDVLERSAAVSAGRPQLVMANELVGFGKLPTLTSDMSLHRKYRRMYARALSGTASQRYWTNQTREMRRTVLQLLEENGDPIPAVKQGVGCIISEVVYGHRLSSPDDEFLVKAREVLVIFERVIRPGAFLVDTFPWLKYIPEWFPGAGFKRRAREWRATSDRLRQDHLDKVKRDMSAGTAHPSYVTNLLSQTEKSERMDVAEVEELVKWSAGTLYGAGSDTTVVTIQNFLVALLQFPKAQERAREEVDRVVGRERMPDIQDRERMPYCQAMVQEILRWRPAVPLGIPHAMLQDELYCGYLLPAGATVIPNIWSLTHDPHLYPNPDQYRPERFLFEDGTKTIDGGREAFGFGRRICAGSHLAESSIFAFITTLIWAANVTGAAGFDGNVDYETGAVNRPKEIPCDIRPRSEQVIEMLRGSVLE